MTKSMIALAVAGALNVFAASAAVEAGSVSVSTGMMGASFGSDALLAIESNRSSIIERLVVEHRAALGANAIAEGTFRAALGALRADQLLAAALVGTLQEVSAIVAAPPADYDALSRYVAVAPTSTLAALPPAEAYLVRSGESLAVVRGSRLQLNADTQLVGYFVAGSSGVVHATSSGGFRFTPKDGPGSGANSWIGYTAGGNVASGPNSAVAAGTANVASAQGAFVGAGTANVASGVSSLVIGGFDNQATSTDALVGAGAGHRATGARSVIVGGGYNVASGNWSFVGGGGRDGIVNTPAGTSPLDNVASGHFSVVTGGQGNRATGAFATVPGGNANLASGTTSFAAGNRAKTQTSGATIHNGTFAFADGAAFDFYTAAANEFAVRATGGVRFVTAIDGTGLPTKAMTLNAAGTLAVPGILNLPSTGGHINKGGTRFLHNTNFPADNSTFLGLPAGNFTMTAGNNTGLGAFTLVANTGGFSNTAVGANAMELNTTGLGNSALGAFALTNNTIGNYNLAVGNSALFLNTTGISNTAGGNATLASNVSGNENTAFGKSASQLNTTGSFNAALGTNALRNTTSGCANTAIGTGAFFGNETGCNNTGVGFNVSLTSINLNNATAIGSNAFVDASNRVRIGDGNVTQIGGQVAWTNLSDRREKKDVRELSLGLDFIKALRPVEYKMRNGNDRIDFGFIAQEVEVLLGTSYNLLGIGGTAERRLSLRYTDLIAPMVKAIQQQQTTIEMQQAFIASQQAQIASQQARFEQRDLEFAELRRSVEVLMARSAPNGSLATVR